MATMKQRPSAEKSYPELFEKLNHFIERLSPWIHGATAPDDSSLFGSARISILFRALNQYRAIVNLLRSNHWEDGLILARSMFELLLNAEELVRQEFEHPGKASQRFFLFSELQNYLLLREIWLYHVAIGRKPSNYEQLIDNLDKSARKLFREFWLPPSKKRKKGKWKESWHNKSKWKLSNESDDPDRMYQYKIAYSMGSQFTHNGPEAVTSLIFQTQKDQVEWQQFISHMDHLEQTATRMAAKNSTGFLMEIVELLRDCLPDYDQNWIDDAFAIIGRI